MSFCLTNIGLVLITKTLRKINDICLYGQWIFLFQREVVLNLLFTLMLAKFFFDDFLIVMDG